MSETIYLKFIFNDGSIWMLPLEVIAKQRAEAFKNDESETGETPEEIYQAEFTSIMKNDQAAYIALEEWFEYGNIDWDDIKQHLIQQAPPAPVDYKKEFERHRFSLDIETIDINKFPVGSFPKMES